MKDGILRKLRHVLVVEHDPNDLFLIRRAFQTVLSYTAQFCSGVSEAQAYLTGSGHYSDRRQYPYPDAVMTDIRFEGRYGTELIEWMNILPDPRPCVIVLTGAIAPDEVYLLYQYGVRHIIDKSADYSALKTSLRQQML